MDNETSTEVIRFVEPVNFDVELKHAVIKTVVVATLAVAATAIAESLSTNIKARLAARKNKDYVDSPRES